MPSEQEMRLELQTTRYAPPMSALLPPQSDSAPSAQQQRSGQTHPYHNFWRMLRPPKAAQLTHPCWRRRRSLRATPTRWIGLPLTWWRARAQGHCTLPHNWACAFGLASGIDS
eukprot:3479444-Prymnesium_polylepis.1